MILLANEPAQGRKHRYTAMLQLNLAVEEKLTRTHGGAKAKWVEEVHWCGDASNDAVFFLHLVEHLQQFPLLFSVYEIPSGGDLSLGPRGDVPPPGTIGGFDRSQCKLFHRSG